MEKDGEFKQMLVDFYESGFDGYLKDWIEVNCLDGTVLVSDDKNAALGVSDGVKKAQQPKL